MPLDSRFQNCRPPGTSRWISVVAALALAAAGCGGDGGDDGGAASWPVVDETTAGETTAGETTAGEPAAGVPASAPACEDGEAGGRRFVLCTAGDATGQRLVVALHGRGSSAAEMQAVTGLDRQAAAAGLAVVFPDAVDGGWGDDTFTTPTRPSGDEDVVALDGLIEAVRADERIGDQPVALVGFSNGASMALRYASDRPDQVAAVVSVAGQLPRDPAVRPAVRIPLLEVYGTADPVRPYDTGIPEPADRQPGGPTPTLSTADTVAAFVAAGGGPGEPDDAREADPTPGDGTRLRTQRWVDGTTTVAVLQAVVGGGHTWPSAQALFAGGEGFGVTSRDLDASAEAIEFVLDPDTAGR
jgi:polyhydroxybutyrate depolymerase